MALTRIGFVVATVFLAGMGLALAVEPTVLPGTRYSMSLPGSPECETQADAEAIKLPVRFDFPASCSAVVDGLKYSFDYWVLPSKVPKRQAEGAMFAAALGGATAMGGDIEGKQVGKVDGFSSLDFTIVVEGRGPIGYGRYVIVKTHLVRAVVEATQGSITRESVDDVLRSLKVK